MSVDAPLAALEAACNRALRLDPEAFEAVRALAGRVVAVEVAPPAWTLFVIPGPGGLQLARACTGAPDTRIRGTPWALARLALSRGADRDGVEVCGDVEVGQRLQAILARLDPDWEEALAGVLGDPAAHRIGRGVRAVGAGVRRGAGTLVRDLADYLHYEARHAPPRREVEALLDAVDRLRADTDRLEARVARLEAALATQRSG